MLHSYMLQYTVTLQVTLHSYSIQLYFPCKVHSCTTLLLTTSYIRLLHYTLLLHRYPTNYIKQLHYVLTLHSYTLDYLLELHYTLHYIVIQHIHNTQYVKQ